MDKKQRAIFGVLTASALLLSASYIALRAANRLLPSRSLTALLLICAAVYGAARIYSSAYPARAHIVMRAVFWLFFGLYLLFLLRLTLFELGYGRVLSFEGWSPEKVAAYFEQEHSFIPGAGTRDVIELWQNGERSFAFVVRNILGNLLAYAPLALFLPLLFRKLRSFFSFFLAVSAIVVAVELLQILLMCGFCDIDDYLVNTAGAVILYALLNTKQGKRLVAHLIPKERIDGN